MCRVTELEFMDDLTYAKVQNICFIIYLTDYILQTMLVVNHFDMKIAMNRTLLCVKKKCHCLFLFSANMGFIALVQVLVYFNDSVL